VSGRVSPGWAWKAGREAEGDGGNKKLEQAGLPGELLGWREGSTTPNRYCYPNRRRTTKLLGLLSLGPCLRRGESFSALPDDEECFLSRRRMEAVAMFEIGGERRGFGRPPLVVLAACLQLVTKVGR